MPVSQAAGQEGLISIGLGIYQGSDQPTFQSHRPSYYRVGEMKWQRG